MKNQVVKIGAIIYKNESQNEMVLLDHYFQVEDLFKILDNDKDVVKFQVEVNPGDIYTFKGTTTVEKNVEIIGTTYNAFAENPYQYKTKTTWNLSNGGYCLKKKDALKAAERQTQKDINFLNSLKVNHGLF